MTELAGPKCSISLTAPAALRRDGPRGIWFATGLSADEVDGLAAADDPGAAGDTTVHRERGASVVFVALDRGAVTGIIAWRGLLGLNDVFYARLRGGSWLVTDHFRNAMSAVPETGRRMSDDALLQHYTCGGVFGRATYANGIRRLMNSDRLDIDVAAGTEAIRCFSRHTSTATDEPREQHLQRIDGALEDVVAPLRDTPAAALGFSGGVDSTLLLSYIGDAGTPLTIKPGSPEFDAETEYAREASLLLGRSHTEVQRDEDEYLERLEGCIEEQGMPLWANVTPMTASMYAEPFSTFAIGEGADSAFGSGRGIRRVAAALSGRSGRALLRTVGQAPGRIGRRANQVGDYATLFAQAPDSPRGYAGTSSEYYGDNTLSRRMFGDQSVEGLYSRFLKEVHERVEVETAEKDRFHRHIELTHWRYIFSDPAMVGHHAAHPKGKLLIHPYLTWRVVAESLKVPAKQRYYRGLTGKWMLKELLARKVPGYEVNQRKLATGLPFDRFYRTGPLARFWERYDMPEVLPIDVRGEVRSRPSPMAWMAVNHAVWEERVVRNQDLRPHPAAIEASWPLAGSHSDA